MKNAWKRKAPLLPKEFFRFSKDTNGYEYYHYPSEQARRIFHHVLSLGEARPPAGWRMNHEKEKGFILHFVLAGKFWHRVGGNTHIAEANDCCLMELTERVDYGTEGPRPAHLLWGLFDGAMMPQTFRELNADMEPICRGVNRRRVATLFRQLIRTIAQQLPAQEAQASALLSGLLAELFLSRSAAAPLISARFDPSKLSLPTRKAMALIARFYKYPRSMKLLAADVGVSRYHFSRLFHRETGFTPNHYLNWYRIEIAKSLLRSTQTPIQKIAETVGLADVEHFSKLFRQFNGTSPRAYRAKAGK